MSSEEALRRTQAIIKTAEDEIVTETPQQSHALAHSAAKGLPPITIGANQGAFLSILCQLIQAKTILEIGTLGGYSTLWFAKSVRGVYVTSIEINPKHRDVALENLSSVKNVDIILGAALDVLPKLAEQGKKFDLVFIDADWDEQREYFDWAVKLTNEGKCVYVDNVVRQLRESEADGNAKGRALIEHVSKDQRVDASLISVLNTHKTTNDELIDGFLIAYVK